MVHTHSFLEPLIAFIVTCCIIAAIVIVYEFTHKGKKYYATVNKAHPCTVEHMSYISMRLPDVKDSGLEVEVITFALQAMKKDPNLSVEQAFEYGCEEWDV